MKGCVSKERFEKRVQTDSVKTLKLKHQEEMEKLKLEQKKNLKFWNKSKSNCESYADWNKTRFSNDYFDYYAND